MPTIEITEEQLGNAKNILQVSKTSIAYNFKGSPEVLRRIVFWAGDALWPEWYSNQTGRKTYLGYADLCDDGKISWSSRMFTPIWPRIQKHLQADGIIIANINE